MTVEAVPCPHSGCVDLRDVRYPDDGVLHLTSTEWVEFLTAMKRGDFDELTRHGETPEMPLDIDPTNIAEGVAEYRQSLIAGFELLPNVPETTRKSYERIRTIYSYGIFNYDLYTVIQPPGGSAGRVRRPRHGRWAPAAPSPTHAWP